MIDEEREIRVATMQCHIDAVYRLFKGFCEETRPEKAPLKNYMKFVTHCIDNMIEESEDE